MNEVRAEMIEQVELADLSTTPSQYCSPVLDSRVFRDWLQEQRLGPAFTTYQTENVYFVGLKSDHALSVFERTDRHCMGMWASPDARTLWRPLFLRHKSMDDRVQHGCRKINRSDSEPREGETCGCHLGCVGRGRIRVGM